MNGIVFAVLASFLFACMNASAKFLSASMALPEIVLYRGLLGVALTLIFVTRSKVKMKVHNWPLLLSRGLLGAASLLLAFLAISRIDLAEASFLAHLSPVLTVVLASLILKERMPEGSFSIVLLVSGGALLVAAPWNITIHLFYAGVGITGAVLASLASLSIRQLAKDHDNYTIMLAFLGAAILLPFPFVEWTSFSLPTGWNALATLVLGTVSFLAQWCLTQAYRLEKAGVVAMTRYVGIVFNIGFGYIFWREIPAGSSMLGGLLILVGCLSLSALQRKAAKE